MKRRITTRAVIFKDDKLLCARLKNGRAITNEYWCVPGGGVEDGEALLPSLKREIVEETGIVPKIGSLLYVQQFAHNGVEYLEFFFNVTNADDYAKIDLSKTTHGHIEIAEIAFIDPGAARLLPAFLTTQPIADDIANLRTKFFDYLR